MTLDQLQHELGALKTQVIQADAHLLDSLLERIHAWKADEAVPGKLMADLDHALGQAWFANDSTHTQVHGLLETFRRVVTDLGGVTMNERLVIFGLLNSWEHSNESRRETLQVKLLARP